MRSHGAVANDAESANRYLSPDLAVPGYHGTFSDGSGNVHGGRAGNQSRKLSPLRFHLLRDFFLCKDISDRKDVFLVGTRIPAVNRAEDRLLNALLRQIHFDIA